MHVQVHCTSTVEHPLKKSIPVQKKYTWSRDDPVPTTECRGHQLLAGLRRRLY